jgi:hypothetical protein
LPGSRRRGGSCPEAGTERRRAKKNREEPRQEIGQGRFVLAGLASP